MKTQTIEHVQVLGRASQKFVIMSTYFYPDNPVYPVEVNPFNECSSMYEQISGKKSRKQASSSS